MIWTKRGIALFAILLMAFAVPVSWGYSSKSAEEIMIASNEVVNDDLYLFGNTIQIDGEVNGDVFVGANELIIS